MKKTILISTLSLMALCSACSSNQKATANTADTTLVAVDTIPYTIGKNYFAIVEGYKTVIIDNQKDFDATFNAAAFMGKDGEPTQIDFSKQFVAGIILPESNKATQISIKSLSKEGDKLRLIYQVSEGEEQSFTTRPMQFIIIDKEHYATPDIQVEGIAITK